MAYYTGPTFGFGLKIKGLHRQGFLGSLDSIAEKYLYRYADSTNKSEESVQDGLASIHKNLCLGDIYVLRSDKCRKDFLDDKSDVQYLAYNIEEELFQQEISNKRPKFFDFLFELSIIAKPYTSELVFFFADEEWRADQYVRYHEGFVEDLVVLLRQTSSWSIAVRNLHDMSHTSFDAIPLVYKVKLIGEGDKEK